MRDCGHCQEWLYDLETGHQTFQITTGKGVKRSPNDPAPCRKPSGCPKGTPENQLSLSEKNKRAYRFHLQCESLGHFPDDGIVRRNAGLIAFARARAAQHRQWQQDGHQGRLERMLLAVLQSRAI